MLVRLQIKKIYKKISQRNIVAIILIFSFLIVAEYMSYQHSPHKSVVGSAMKKYYFAPVLEDVKNYYDVYNQPLQTDEYLMHAMLWPEQNGQLQRIFDKDPFDRIYQDALHIDDLSITRRVESGGDVIDLFLREGVETPLYDIDQRYRNMMIDPTDEVIIKALYCDASGYDDFDQELLGLIRDNEGGYGDTHNLLGLIIIEKLGCRTGEEIFNEKKKVIRSIITAQEVDQEFSDLFAERIVLLFWAGKGDMVDIHWIEGIVKNAQVDNGWRDRGDTEANPHTTGLAALSIKYFIAGEMHQDVLVQ